MEMILKCHTFTKLIQRNGKSKAKKKKAVKTPLIYILFSVCFVSHLTVYADIYVFGWMILFFFSKPRHILAVQNGDCVK